MGTSSREDGALDRTGTVCAWFGRIPSLGHGCGDEKRLQTAHVLPPGPRKHDGAVVKNDSETE
jgi:hypothetical protein